MIFISYRSTDSRDLVTGLDRDLTREFGAGSVFRDLTRLEAGQDWTEVVEKNAKERRVMLVIIGPDWQTTASTDVDQKGMLRLMNPEDWVRKELLLAFGARNVVIPVLVNGTPMPTSKWLHLCGLDQLAPLQGHPLRATEYDTDLAKLIAVVRKHCPELNAGHVAHNSTAGSPTSSMQGRQQPSASQAVQLNSVSYPPSVASTGQPSHPQAASTPVSQSEPMANPGSTYRPPEVDLATLSEPDLARHLDQLAQTPDPAGLMVIFHGLGHSNEAARQHAYTAALALGWDRLSEAVVARVRSGDEPTCEALLRGLGHCPSIRETVTLLDRLCEFLPEKLSRTAEEMAEHKRLKLGLEEIRERFRAVGGRYEIEDYLGSGVVTTAYRARDPVLNRLVVVRLLRDRYANDSRVRRGFRELCKKTAGRGHENLVQVIGFEELGHQVACVVREHVLGATLRDIIKSGRRLSLRKAIQTLYKVVSALTPLHVAGIPHCGIRPGNIFLSKGHPFVQLGDLSLVFRGGGLHPGAIGVGDARLPRLAEDTRYTAPEAIAGAPVIESDFYSLGCVAYELLCGTPPFTETEWVSVAVAQARTAIVPPSTANPLLSPAADRVVMRLLENDPARRYRSISEVKRALRGLSKDQGGGQNTRSPDEPPPAGPRLDPHRDPKSPQPRAEVMPVPSSDQPPIADVTDARATPSSTGDDLSVAAPAVGIVTLAKAQDLYRSLIPLAKPSVAVEPISRVPLEPTLQAVTVTGELGYSPASGGPVPEIPGYKIVRRLGEGGMGVVFLAEQVALRRTVAIKMLRDVRLDRGARFLTEARASATIRHQHVVHMYDYGEFHGVPYLVMEYLSGGDLANQIRVKGPMPPQDAAILAAKLAGALQFIHELGIIHRDVKPSNVLFDERGEPKLADFGLAKQEENVAQTATGAVIGTPAYMAPEQARGEPVAYAADVFSLGCVLYEMLTGTRPFTGSYALEILNKLVQEDPTRPRQLNPAIPRDLEQICLKCLAKNPADRYSARELAEELSRFLSGQPVGVPRVGGLTRLWRWIRRRFG
jgi:serine/threonine protein kinase